MLNQKIRKVVDPILTTTQRKWAENGECMALPSPLPLSHYPPPWCPGPALESRFSTDFEDGTLPPKHFKTVVDGNIFFLIPYFDDPHFLNWVIVPLSFISWWSPLNLVSWEISSKILLGWFRKDLTLRQRMSDPINWTRPHPHQLVFRKWAKINPFDCRP